MLQIHLIERLAKERAAKSRQQADRARLVKTLLKSCNEPLFEKILSRLSALGARAGETPSYPGTCCAEGA